MQTHTQNKDLTIPVAIQEGKSVETGSKKQNGGV
jgi:hypothetical protein